MNPKLLLAGACASALLASHAFAQDATTPPPAKHRHHAGSSLEQRLDRLEKVIENQQSEIRSLKSQLGGPGTASGGAGSVATAQPPQPQPEVSAAQFQALQNQVNQQQAAVETVTKPKDKKIHFKGVTVTFGGFLAAESVYRSHEEYADIGSTFSGIPYSNSPQAHADEFRMTARQSRVSALVQGDVDPVTHLAMYGEFDFMGGAASANSNESNSYQPRVRNLYGTIDWDNPGVEFLAGQSWSLATLTGSGMSPRSELPPPTIDAQYVPGFDWTRQPQLRVTKNFNDQVWLGLSVENPQTTFGGTVPSVPGLYYNSGNGFNGGTGTASSEFNPGITLSLNHVPDVIGKVAVEPSMFDKNVHLEAFGIYRDFYDRYGTDPNLTDVSTHDVSGGGFGTAALIKLVPGVFDLQADGLFGDGIGRYGSGQLPDATFKPDGEIAPLTEDMEMVGATWHSTPALDLYVFAGREHDDAKSYDVSGTPFGYGNPLYVNTGCFSLTAALTAKCTGNTQEIDQITAGIWDNPYTGDYGKVRIGLQYSYTERKAFNGVGGRPTANENMLFTSFRYYPF
ncbi:MAG TPA: hypothetical protein VHU23_19075 [Rhizomicrobium sp.]|jgi:hypothetical protein|nr:hypothetical protein [Rhizomicrobium sp.]